MDIRISKSKVRVLSETLQDMGQVFFASILVEPIVSHTGSMYVTLIGLSLSFLCWGVRIPLS